MLKTIVRFTIVALVLSAFGITAHPAHANQDNVPVRSMSCIGGTVVLHIVIPESGTPAEGFGGDIFGGDEDWEIEFEVSGAPGSSFDVSFKDPRFTDGTVLFLEGDE